ncbi:cobyrinate a,c-diamide synthase [Ammonifex thiophilus]|uniref:Cobyrinate a,c-diamide synthase n=1 Tax=Ammonifex thiophilus TaxID=444093 RepID=A0A3D8P5D3_9THEO|nr:cobyrinate a,c-diamide synthase [Ammonifex thiophilus]RDV84553.1 hydrogenobyrinic acid a,c-diamide synthase (glutamine-hydrolyzing) [Ammonifex thiophilus]
MPEVCTIPRLVVAAPQGRSGKTTITLGLVAALRARGLTVQPFKKGPDFIDPGWLGRAAGRPCRNLDAFFFSRETLAQVFARGAQGADVAVVEGAMGLFDGVDLEGSGSTAEIAKIIRSPVVLVVNATRMTRSAAAMVLGFKAFDPELELGGVILNHVARPRHERMLREAIKRFCHLPVLGVFPKCALAAIPDRHLGLVPVGEEEREAEILEVLRELAEKYLDIEGILALARRAAPLAVSLPAGSPAGRKEVRLGVFRDRAFSFYYPENLEALEAAGAELCFVNALEDDLPPVDGLYIGGGFPEIFAACLEANEGLRRRVREAAEAGMPIYAECGGLMYLSRSLIFRGHRYAMAGVFPFDITFSDRPSGHGYMRLRALGGNPFFPAGERLLGHEFHHSRPLDLSPSTLFGFAVERGYGINGAFDGAIYRSTLAAYCHLHALAAPGWAPALVAKAREFRKGGL